jgi:hypothetical protein
MDKKELSLKNVENPITSLKFQIIHVSSPCVGFFVSIQNFILLCFVLLMLGSEKENHNERENGQSTIF